MKKYKKIASYSSEIIDLNESAGLDFIQTRNKMLLAANIEDHMLSRKWTKTEFASRIGRHPSELSRWFSGTHNFTLETLTEIAYAFEIEINDLFGKRSLKSNVVTYRETLKHKPHIVIVTPVVNDSGGSEYENIKNDQTYLTFQTVNE